jgi:transposase-like protein
VPAVVQFDGIWLREQTQTETVKLDKRGRKRQQREGKKVVVLVALGLWTDGSGRREILDWQVADGESKAAWEPFVHRLWERGLRPETGLQAVIRDGCGELGEAIAWVYGSTVIEQRCIFHKLRNVADKCREELKGEAKKETRKLLMEQASAVYQAESAQEARERLATFAHTWRARTPKTVATLERDFEQTIAYFALEGVARELIRTTSLLERTRSLSCGASFARCAALAVPQARRWRSIYKSNGSMLAGRSKRGGIPLTISISISSISTLSKGYAT